METTALTVSLACAHCGTTTVGEYEDGGTLDIRAAHRCSAMNEAHGYAHGNGQWYFTGCDCRTQEAPNAR